MVFSSEGEEEEACHKSEEGGDQRHSWILEVDVIGEDEGYVICTTCVGLHNSCRGEGSVFFLNCRLKGDTSNREEEIAISAWATLEVDQI